MEQSRQSLTRSFWSAFRGIKHVLRERNFVIQLFMGLIAVSLSLGVGLMRDEKIVILILIAFVLASEIMNSACERILDFVTREHHAEVARIKDMLAGAVLVYSMTAFVIGIWIFGNALMR